MTPTLVFSLLIASAGTSAPALAQGGNIFREDFVVGPPEPVQRSGFAELFDINDDGTRLVVDSSRAPDVVEKSRFFYIYERASVDMPWGAPVARFQILVQSPTGGGLAIDGDYVYFYVAETFIPDFARFYQRINGTWTYVREAAQVGRFDDGVNLTGCGGDAQSRWVELTDVEGRSNTIVVDNLPAEDGWCTAFFNQGLMILRSAEGFYALDGSGLNYTVQSGFAAPPLPASIREFYFQVDGAGRQFILTQHDGQQANVQIYEERQGVWSEAFASQITGTSPEVNAPWAAIEGDLAIVTSGASPRLQAIVRQDGVWTLEPRSRLGNANTRPHVRGGKVFVTRLVDFIVDGERFDEFGVGQFDYGPALGRGEPCELDSYCESERCIDGVCCFGRCGGSCSACNLPGSEGFCEAVPAGPPPPDRAACPGQGSPCGGTCDGTSFDCRYPDASVECSGASCASGTAVSASVCNGAGACTGISMETCGAYTCDEAGLMCLEACSNDSQCEVGYVCRDGACELPQTGGCQSDADCTAGFVCGAGSVCEPQSQESASGGSSSSDCTSVAPSDLSLFLLLFLGGIPVLRRRAEGKS